MDCFSFQICIRAYKFDRTPACLSCPNDIMKLHCHWTTSFFPFSSTARVVSNRWCNPVTVRAATTTKYLFTDVQSAAVCRDCQKQLSRFSGITISAATFPQGEVITLLLLTHPRYDTRTVTWLVFSLYYRTYYVPFGFPPHLLIVNVGWNHFYILPLVKEIWL